MLWYKNSFQNTFSVDNAQAFLKLAKKNDLQDVYFSAKLKKRDTGFHYLDIPNEFAKALFSLLDPDEEAQKDPYAQKQYGGVGAHVSVISDKELEGKDIKIKEVGESFKFKIKNVKKVKPEGWDEMDMVYFVQIDCPELKEMRKSYGLPATYYDKKHEFHITFAIKRKK